MSKKAIPRRPKRKAPSASTRLDLYEDVRGVLADLAKYAGRQLPEKAFQELAQKLVVIARNLAHPTQRSRSKVRDGNDLYGVV